jgi:hypothetical protein
MATMTLAEAQAQLTTVQAALSSIIAGNRLNRLEVGSGAFKRVYQYQEITVDELKKLQQELLAIIDSLSPTTLPTFRANATIPLIVQKDIYNV